MEKQDLRKRIDETTAAYKAEMMAGSWWHSIDLGDNYVTPGVHTLEELRDNYQRFHLPGDLSGKRLLDIGCWDGFYSFEAEKHGAEVRSVDCWTPENYAKAKRALGARAEFRELSVYDVTREELGSFDIVLFLGVLYHLRHPLLALEQVCEVTTEYAIIESHVVDDFFELPQPVMEFYEFDELGGQYDNWWGPNVECMLRMIRAAGFARTEVLRREPTRATIKAYRRWDDMQDEATPSLRLTDIINAIRYDQHFPTRGAHAMLALEVGGLPAEATRVDVRVEVGGFGINPVYVGPWGGGTRPGQSQINVTVPLGLDEGEVAVRVWHKERRSNEYVIRLSKSTQRW